MLFGSLKGINDGEDPMVEVIGVELLLVLELFGSLNGMRELLLLTVELLELLELVRVGVTVDVFTYGELPGCFVK